jgi:cytidylate kinase
MAIVTIAGQYGSGGQDVGREVARLINAEFVDREILAEAARRTGISEQEWEARDMRVATLQERIARGFQAFLARSAAGYTGDPYLSGEPLLSRTYEQQAAEPTTPEQQLDDQRFLEVTTQIIREIAELPNAVIIGRGASYILHAHPRAFHVLTIAPKEYRARVVLDRDRVSMEQAVRIADEQERHRHAFIRKFFHMDPLDPTPFDLVLQTGRLDIRHYAEIVAAGARALDARVLGGA